MIPKPARRAMRGAPVGADKPPYAVPSMRDVREVRHNRFNVCSTFSGCGGSSLGFRMAGFRVLWANEFVDAARATYEANKAAYTVVDPRDIRLVRPEEILEAAKLRPGELDVLEGSPPCSSFSTAGDREKNWGKSKAYSDVAQRTDDLFFEFSRIVKGVQPKVFVAENVSGLVKGVAKGYFVEIYRALADCGYVVNARMLDAQWLGVPQQRQRIIFVGVRNDLGLQPSYPRPFAHRYSLRDAIGDLAPNMIGVQTSKGVLDPAGPAPTVLTHQRRHTRSEMSIVERKQPTKTEDYDGTLVGYCTEPEWRRLREGEQSNRYFNLIKARWDLPCPTMTATNGKSGSAAAAHPSEPRKFTIPELRRICSFPDDFVLTGTFGQQCERLGRSVPPLMMRAIAESVAETLRSAIATKA